MIRLKQILSVGMVVASMMCFTACSDTEPVVPETLPPYKPITPQEPEDKPGEEPGEEAKDITSGMAVLDNGHICLKQDMDRGGSICYLSQSGSTKSVVNIADEGRLIQQSYYAGKRLNRQDEGQSPSWSPWNWNPIQGGNYAGKKARVLEGKLTSSSLYVKCVPMLWDMNNHEAEAIMEQWTELDGNVAHVRCKITCNRPDNDIYGGPTPSHQEIPAVYTISSLTNLYSYVGDAPFTGATVSKLDVQYLSDGFWGRYSKVPEQWMAFVDNNSWGLGVYSPRAEMFNAGFSDHGAINDDVHNGTTGHMAPICTMSLDRKSVMEYEYWLILDRLDAIRSTAYKLKDKLNDNNKGS